MAEDWDEVGDRKLPSTRMSFHPNRIQLLTGFTLGLISAVVHPGLIVLMWAVWLIPAGIAAILWLRKPIRSLAVGFAAASVAWLTFGVTFLAYMAAVGG